MTNGCKTLEPTFFLTEQKAFQPRWAADDELLASHQGKRFGAGPHQTDRYERRLFWWQMTHEHKLPTVNLLLWQLSAMFQADWPHNLWVDVCLSCHISAANAAPPPITSHHTDLTQQNKKWWMLVVKLEGKWSETPQDTQSNRDFGKWNIPQPQMGQLRKIQLYRVMQTQCWCDT